MLGLAWIVAPATIIACHTLQNNDLPLHLAIGDWILEHREVPDRDPLSGNALGERWVPHEWLAGVVYSVVHRTTGALGLIALAMGLSLLLAAVHRRVTQQLGVTLPFHLLAAIPLWVMAGRRLMLRPHLFALGLIFLTWNVLLGARRQAALLWTLPVILALWVNLHASFFVGLAAIAADLVLCGSQHQASWRQRLLVLGLCVGALFVQPHGLGALTFPFQLTGQETFMQEIAEWAPPFGASLSSELFRQTPAFALSLAWILALAVGAARRGKQVPISYALFVLGTLVLYLQHQRHLALFALTSLPLIVGSGWVPSASWQRSWRSWIPHGATLLTVFFLITPGYPVRWDAFRSFPRGGDVQLWGSNLPLVEADILRTQGYQGLVLCEYDYGGVISWVSEGRLRPSMDSRNTVYGPEKFIAHQAGLANGEIELLERAVAVLVRSPWAGQPRSDLHRRLEDDPNWLLVRFSWQRFLYVRAGAGGLDSRAFRYAKPASGRISLPQPSQIPTLLDEAETCRAATPPAANFLVVYALAHAYAAQEATDDALRVQHQATFLKTLEVIRRPYRDPGWPVAPETLRALEALLQK